MRKTLTLIGAMLIVPMLQYAQFSSRVHGLRPASNQSYQQLAADLNERLSHSVDTAYDRQLQLQAAALLSSMTDFAQTLSINGVTPSAEQELLAKMSEQLTVASQQVYAVRDTLKAYLDKAVHQAITDRLSDSLPEAAYLELVHRSITDTLSALTAGTYRNCIDARIVREYAFCKAVDQWCAGKDSGTIDVLASHLIDSMATNKDSLVRVLWDSLDRIEAMTPMLYRAREYFDLLNRSELNPVHKPWWFPLKSVTHAEYMYFGNEGKRMKLLTNFGLQSNFSDQTTVTSEILSGIFPFEAKCKKGDPQKRFALPLKFDLGITVTKDGADTSGTEQQHINNLLYGGLLHARVSYPVFYSNWKYYNGKGIRVYAPLAATFNWNGKAGERQLWSDLYQFTEFSANIYLESDLIQSAAAKSEVTVFLNGKYALMTGGSKFYSYHGLEQGTPLRLFQVNGGIRIKDRFSIAFNVPVWASDAGLLDNVQAKSLAILIDPNF